MENMFKVNHSEAKGGTFEPLAVGEYEVIISEAKIETAKTSGNQMVKATLTVRQDVEQPGKNRKIFDNLVATQAAMWKFQQLFKALNFEDGKSFSGGIVEVAKEIMNKPVRVKIKHENYTNGQGEQKVAERVDFYTTTQNPLAAGATTGGGLDPFATPVPAGNSGTAGNLDDYKPF